MTIRRTVVLAVATLVAALLVTAVLLSPVKGNSDRGVLPPIDNPPATEPR